MTINKFKKYINLIGGTIETYDFKNKCDAITQSVIYMLARTQSMFKWSGLPKSIPQRILELYLQINGNCAFYKYNDTLYTFVGGMGGEPDVYYMPTIYTVANPALNFSRNLVIDKECVVMANDSMYTGLIPLNLKHATALAETELSINIANINSRIASLISASDDRTEKSAKKFLADIEKGELGVIAENAFLEGLKTKPYSSTSQGSGNITNLIELNQYIKASWYNDLGLNANYNMKRESINSGESQLNNDALLPLVDDMLNMRRQGAEKVNDMFGTNISVELSSSWEDNQIEIENEHSETQEGGDENEIE